MAQPLAVYRSVILGNRSRILTVLTKYRNRSIDCADNANYCWHGKFARGILRIEAE